jgi:hypothetical protein
VSAKVSTSGLLTMLASAAVVVVLYYADLANTPVLANYLDALGDRVVGAWPVLRQFHVASMILPCLVVGLAFFIVTTVVVAVFVRPRAGEKMERRLKKAADRKRRRLRKIEVAECIVLDQPAAWPLDMPLMTFGKDSWTLRDSFGDVLIVGQKGSGKSSASGKTVAMTYLRAGFGGLVVCSQIEEAEVWRSYLRAAGRESDGRFFTMDGSMRFNFLQYESEKVGAESVENLTNLLLTVSSSRQSQATGSNAEFWLLQKKRLIRNCLSLLKVSKEPVQLSNLYKLMISAPQDVAQTKNDDWKKNSYVSQCLSKGDRDGDLEWPMLRHFWLREWPALKERPTVESDFSGMLDNVARGELAELFGTTNTLTPDDILDGRVVVIDIPLMRYDEVGRYAALIWIQLFQRAMNRRSYVEPENRPMFLWEDESQYFCLPNDSRFQTTSRHKGISVVRLTQNIPNFRHSYGSQDAVDSLLGGHVTKVFHRNDCPVTNEWASKIIAKDKSYKHSLSESSSVQANASVSQSEEYSCSTMEFLGLKNGGASNNHVVESVLFQSGRLWQKDKRWLLTNWKQA